MSSHTCLLGPIVRDLSHLNVSSHNCVLGPIVRDLSYLNVSSHTCVLGPIVRDLSHLNVSSHTCLLGPIVRDLSHLNLSLIGILIMFYHLTTMKIRIIKKIHIRRTHRYDLENVWLVSFFFTEGVVVCTCVHVYD